MGGQIRVPIFSDTDIVVASGKAYVNALNKLEFVKRRKIEAL